MFYKVKEPDFDSLHSSGKLQYLPPRFMTVCRYRIII